MERRENVASVFAECSLLAALHCDLRGISCLVSRSKIVSIVHLLIMMSRINMTNYYYRLPLYVELYATISTNQTTDFEVVGVMVTKNLLSMHNEISSF